MATQRRRRAPVRGLVAHARHRACAGRCAGRRLGGLDRQRPATRRTGRRGRRISAVCAAAAHRRHLAGRCERTARHCWLYPRIAGAPAAACVRAAEWAPVAGEHQHAARHRCGRAGGHRRRHARPGRGAPPHCCAPGRRVARRAGVLPPAGIAAGHRARCDVRTDRAAHRTFFALQPGRLRGCRGHAGSVATTSASRADPPGGASMGSDQ